MSPPLRVLLVEDSPSDAKLVLLALRDLQRPIEHRRVDDPAAMRAALSNQRWDLVLSDWAMPHFSALAALELAKELALELPFIIVSGTIGEEAAADAMRAGARDYVLKDRLARLAPAVERELREAAGRAARRRAEEAVRAHEARFRKLIEKSDDGLAMIAADGTTRYLSPAGARILGAGERAGKPAFELVHPDDRGPVTAAVARVNERPGASVRLDFRIVRPDGAVRWLEGAVTNLLHEPEIEALVGNFRDVTERTQAIAALRVSEARFARLAESGIVGIIVADISGDVLEANDAYLAMVGYTRAEVLANPLHRDDLTPPSWRAADALALEQLLTHGVVAPREKELFRKDGSRVPILVGQAMLEHPRFIAFIADLSERKRAEAALRRSEEQLRNSQKMEAVGRLASGVAHDFNNVLSVILSYASLLLGDIPAGNPMREDVTEIKTAAERAAHLTRQLLLFSRHQVVQPRVLDLNELLTNLDKMLHRLVGEDVDLFLSAGPTVGRIKIDPGHVEQIVMNLVVNARDAMPTGGKLTIETRNVDLDDDFADRHLGVRPGPHVMLAVSDAGLGMDKETQARIFEPFFTTKGAGKGTGLGLSTVFGIVQQNGGTIWVYSEPGKGSTFKVYLPRIQEEIDAVRVRTAPLTVSGSETILLVEDEEQVRVVARGILRRAGYNVIEPHDVADALQVCETHAGPIHLLLTDVVMPQMSGPELAHRLATVQPQMKVLCMSGYTDDSIVRHGVIESDMAFIQKPFTPESLARRVREVLDGG